MEANRQVDKTLRLVHNKPDIDVSSKNPTSSLMTYVAHSWEKEQTSQPKQKTYKTKINEIQKQLKSVQYNLATSVIASNDEKFIDFATSEKIQGSGNFCKVIDVVQNDVPVFCKVPVN